jgi:hypothetical protein
MPDGPRLDSLTADLDAAFARDGAPISDGGCRAVEACAQRHSRHLELHFEAGSAAEPDAEPRGWPPPDHDLIRTHAAAVSSVRRTEDGAWVLKLDGLEPLAVAGPYLDAAFTLADGASRLVLDLRANQGGDPATVAMIAGRLLGGGARHLSDVVHRDRRRQWWTTDQPLGRGLTQPLDVLVSGRTYSSAEALAYHLQARGRATVAGERTRGAADHITPIRLTRQVLGFLPEAYVRDAETGGNWEGTGVVPDAPASGD